MSIVSTPRRFNEAAHACRTYSGLPPISHFFGSSLVRMLANLVARKTSSRRPRIVRPISSSLSPIPWASTVSRKFAPQIQRSQKRRRRLLIVPFAIKLAHTRAAQFHPGDDRILGIQPDLFHAHTLLDVGQTPRLNPDKPA